MLPEKLVADIVKEQSLIIGESLARSRAENTGVVSFKSNKVEDVTLATDNTQSAIGKLIQSYGEVFGQASIEVCLSVIKRYPSDDVRKFLPENIIASL